MGERLAYQHAVEGIAVMLGKFPDLHDRFLVERKAFDPMPGAQLRHGAQLSAVGAKDYQTPDGVRVAPAVRLLATLV